MNNVYDALVVGGGVNGLATLFHLQRLGLQSLALVERFSLGHEHGSSHGKARVTRSTYPHADYVRLMRHVHEEEWPRLEAEAGSRLVHWNRGCFFGPPGDLFDRYADAVTQAGANVDRLEPSDARRVFPQFRFDDVPGVLLDHTAGVVAAEETIDSLVRIARRHRVDLFEETTVLTLDPTREPIRLETTKGTLSAERVVLTAGPWTGALVPFLASRLRVARQTVGYFRLAGQPEDYRIGRFPVWVYLEGGENNVHYGLPEFGQPGIKLARHVTVGGEDDPDLSLDAVASEDLDHLERFLTTHMTAPVVERTGAEHCLYTNAANEDFILDTHPENPRIAIGAGFSGHGFKFGPLTGRILAELVTSGRVDVPEFQEIRSRFALPGGTGRTI